MFVNDWFLPSALIPGVFGRLTYCFGATMAIRRSNLIKFGAFDALANVLADDFMLGRLVHEQGNRVALVPYIVENVIEDPSLKALFLHELRWARTIRSVEPLGYAVEATPTLLDPAFPGWGTSAHHRVTLRSRTTLSELLGHLYVLVPVLDDEKHYWVGDDEVDKLLAKGADTLPKFRAFCSAMFWQ